MVLLYYILNGGRKMYVISRICDLLFCSWTSVYNSRFTMPMGVENYRSLAKFRFALVLNWFPCHWHYLLHFITNPVRFNFISSPSHARAKKNKTCAPGSNSFALTKTRLAFLLQTKKGMWPISKYLLQISSRRWRKYFSARCGFRFKFFLVQCTMLYRDHW